jgi:thiol-disulfide isomerase/thioredoxin
MLAAQIQAGAMTGKPRQIVIALFLPLIVAGLLTTAVCAGGTLEPFEDNGPHKDFNLADLKGTPHALADYRGKVVVVNFWASWCPPCIKEMPGMQRLQAQLAEQPFVILPVNVGEQKFRVWKFIKLINFDLPVLLDTDSKTFAVWDASVLPTSFVLDAKGYIRYRVTGDLEWDSEEVVSLIKELLHTEEYKQ